MPEKRTTLLMKQVSLDTSEFMEDSDSAMILSLSHHIDIFSVIIASQ